MPNRKFQMRQVALPEEPPAPVAKKATSSIIQLNAGATDPDRLLFRFISPAAMQVTKGVLYIEGDLHGEISMVVESQEFGSSVHYKFPVSIAFVELPDIPIPAQSIISVTYSLSVISASFSCVALYEY